MNDYAAGQDLSSWSDVTVYTRHPEWRVVDIACFSCEFKNGTKFKYLPGNHSTPGF